MSYLNDKLIVMLIVPNAARAEADQKQSRGRAAQRRGAAANQLTGRLLLLPKQLVEVPRGAREGRQRRAARALVSSAALHQAACLLHRALQVLLVHEGLPAVAATYLRGLAQALEYSQELEDRQLLIAIALWSTLG